MLSQSAPRLIEGRHHPLVKEVRRMVRSGELWADGLVLLETARLVKDALNSGIQIPKVFLSPRARTGARDLLKKLPPETTVYEVSPEVFELLASTETSQGILALASAPGWQENDLFPRRSALVLVLAGVQDPGNLGAILRTAEAFGTTGIILTAGTVSPYNAKVVRAAAGALLRMPMLRDQTVTEILALLARKKVRLLAGVVEGGKNLPAVDFSGPMAVAVGAEGSGLPKELSAAGELFTIPIASAVESLNVAAATAVILYEIARQRNEEGNREQLKQPGKKGIGKSRSLFPVTCHLFPKS